MWMVSCLHGKILHLSRAGRKRLHDQQPNENSNGKRLGPHAANLEFHCEEMKAAPPSRALGSKMSALGHERTFANSTMSALPPKADILRIVSNVR